MAGHRYSCITPKHLAIYQPEYRDTKRGLRDGTWSIHTSISYADEAAPQNQSIYIPLSDLYSRRTTRRTDEQLIWNGTVRISNTANRQYYLHSGTMGGMVSNQAYPSARNCHITNHKWHTESFVGRHYKLGAWANRT